MRFRSLLVLVLFAATAPAQRPDHSPYVTTGPLHRVFLEKDDPVLSTLLDRGAVRHIEEYESFLFVIFDETPLGGRSALAALEASLRDEDAVVGFNDAPLDTADRSGLERRLFSIPEPLTSAAGPFVSPSGRELVVVQFIGPVKDEWLDDLASTGARIQSYVSSNSYVVAADARSRAGIEALRRHPAVQWIGEYHPYFRLAPDLRRRAVAGGLELSDVTIQVIADEEAIPFVLALYEARLEEKRTPSLVLGYLNLHFRVPDRYLALIAAHPSVFAVEPLPEERLFDEVQAQIVAGNLVSGGAGPSGPGYLAWLASKGFANGQFGFVVDVTDDGIDRGSASDVNVEFRVGGAASGSSRVAYNNNFTGDSSPDSGRGHGNLNASILGGWNGLTGAPYEDASGFNLGLGVCPFVKLGNTKVFSNGNAATFTQPTASRLASAWNAGARISTNSWGYTTGNNYNYDSQAHDAVVRDAVSSAAGNQEMMIVFAAGNAGPGANTVRPPGTAKNVVTVAAGENARPTGIDGCGIDGSGANNANDIATFSARGPSADLRKKPDLVAPGTHVQGAVSRSFAYTGAGVCNPYWPSGQALYCWSSGTSHSAPAVAGAAALIRQSFVNQGLATPSPAMLKAVLLGSARFLNGAGANDTLWSNSQGLGGVDLGRAFNSVPRVLVDQTQVLGATGQTWSVTSSIVTSAEPLRVALVWTDQPGPTTGNAWVNNLDLEVTVNGTLYRGNVFSGSTSIPGGVADPRNNAEVVFLPAGTTGTVLVTVRATNVAGDGVPGNSDSTDQDFALLIQNATAAASPNFTLAATPASGTIVQGQSTTYAVTNTATGGFGSTVSLSVSPAVAGITYSFSPNPEAANGSSTLTVATTTSAATGTRTLTITGTGAGLTRSTTVTLVVNPASASPNFTLAATPASRTIVQGQSTTYAVTNTATGGFGSTVSLSVSPAVAGIAYSFSPNPEAANGSSTLTVATTTSAATGTRTLTITGTGAGLTRSTTVTLVVNPAAASPNFTLAATPASRTIVQGQSTTYAVTNTATGGFGSTVSLSVSPAVAGITYSFSPNPEAANGSSTLTVATTTSAATGTRTLTITGTGGGLTRSTTVTLVVNPAATNQVKTYTVTPNLAIPDNNATGATSSIYVPVSQTISSISVGASITHGYIGQLVVTLVAPNGVQRKLHNGTGGSADNIVTTWSIVTTPTESLTTLNAANTGGTWSLKVQDLASGYTGTLGSWTITFNGEKSVTSSLAIPDYNTTGITSALNFAATGVVAAVKVRVNVSHPNVGDLHVTLVAPDNTQVVLHNRTGGTADNVATEYPDLTVPAASLSAFTGRSITGNWSLKVKDLAAGSSGSLVSWTLSLKAQ